MEMNIINAEDGIGMNVSTGGGGGTKDHSKLQNLDYEHSGHTGFAANYVVELTKENDEITSNKTINEIIEAYKKDYLVKGILTDTEAGVDFNLQLLIAFEDSDFGLVQFATVYDSGDDFKSITIIGTLENNEDSWQYLDREMAYTAGTGIEITSQNVINNTAPNKIISITADPQTMELDKTAGEINSLIEQGYLILLMGRLMFIEEYDSSRNKLYAYFYSGGFATKFTITGNQVTDYESLDVVYDNHYTHTDNNYTTAEKSKLAGLENKIININANPQTMELDKSADEINEYLNNGYIVMALGYQMFRKDYNASTHTIQLAIFFGSFGQILTITGNQITGVTEYFYANDANYVHTDNNFSTYYKDKLDNIVVDVVVDLSSYQAGDFITDSNLVSKLKDERVIVKYNGSNYRFATTMGTGYIYTVMNSLTAGAYITLNYDGSNERFYFYEVGTAPWETPSNKVQNLSTPTTETYPSTLAVYNALQGLGGNAFYLGNVADFTQANPLNISELDVGLYALNPTGTTNTIYVNGTNDGIDFTGVISISNTYGNSTPYMVYLYINQKISDMTLTTSLQTYGQLKAQNFSESSKIIEYNTINLKIQKTTNNVIGLSSSQSRTTFNLLTTNGNQEITGTKAFRTIPECSIVPTQDYHLVNKKYVDDNAGGGGSSEFVVLTNNVMSSLASTDIQKIIDKFKEKSIDQTYILTPRRGTNKVNIIMASLNKSLSTTDTGYTLNVYVLDTITNLQKIDYCYYPYTVTISWSGDVPTVSSIIAGSLKKTVIPLNGYGTSWTPSTDYSPASKKYVDDKVTTYTGYDATKTQVLKNINGTLTWVDET